MDTLRRLRVTFFAAVCLTLVWAIPAEAKQPYSGVTLEFFADDDDFVGDREGLITLLLFPDVAVEQVRVEFEVDYGDAEVVGPIEIELGSLNAGESHVAETTIRLTGLGKTSVRAHVMGVYPASQKPYGESKALYIVSSGAMVKSGTIDFMPLQLELLGRRQEKGLLTKSAYDAERREILYGAPPRIYDSWARRGPREATFRYREAFSGLTLKEKLIPRSESSWSFMTQR